MVPLLVEARSFDQRRAHDIPVPGRLQECARTVAAELLDKVRPTVEYCGSLHMVAGRRSEE
jgi:hypothetical protein